MNDLLATRLSELEGLLFKALTEAETTGREILTSGVFNFQPIRWFAPPIYPYELIDGDSPSIFLSGEPSFRLLPDQPIQEIYDKTIRRLQESPHTVLSADKSWVQYPATSLLGLGSEARVVFSGPAYGKDGTIAPESLQTFAMEFVAVCAASRFGNVIKGPCDFYLDGPSLQAGVRNGKVIGAEHVGDEGGFIEHLLSVPRGIGWVSDTLDTVDRIYFWCEANAHKAEKVAGLHTLATYLKATLREGRDERLAERMLWGASVKPTVARLITNQRLSPQEFNERLDKAFAIMSDIRTPDPLKISQLVELLVPWVISEGGFNKSIWNCNHQVTTLKVSDEAKILRNLSKLKAGGKPPRVETIQPERRYVDGEGAT